MEFPGLGIKSELQLPSYTTATATSDPSRVYDLHHSSWQRQILNPPSEARDQSHILMDASQICFHGTTMETPQSLYFYPFSPSPAGQKTTCGQGLEGPWERPPPLDEPQRVGSSENQVEDPALSGEAWGGLVL